MYSIWGCLVRGFRPHLLELIAFTLFRTTKTTAGIAAHLLSTFIVGEGRVLTAKKELLHVPPFSFITGRGCSRSHDAIACLC
ncbi:hypothetical protein EMIT0P12_30103 [Pseudomonas sp. IT-P12]